MFFMGGDIDQALMRKIGVVQLNPLAYGNFKLGGILLWGQTIFSLMVRITRSVSALSLGFEQAVNICLIPNEE